MTATVTELASPVTTWRAITTWRANKERFERLMDYTTLPYAAVDVRPEAVYVTVCHLDDLERWRDELGGRIEVSPPHAGLRMWVLHTQTPGSPSVPVRVSTLAVDGCSVPAGLDDMAVAA